MNKSLNLPPANYSLTLVTLAGLLVGSALTFLFSEAFSTNLPQTLLVALIFSLFWVVFYTVKNYRESPSRNKEIYSALFFLLLAGILIWYLFPQLNGFSIPISAFIIWPAAFTLVYKIAESLNTPEVDKFVFHNGAEQRPASHDLSKIKTSKDKIAFHLENDGLDPQIIFNVEKTGASHLIKIQHISAADQFSHYLSRHDITVKELGMAIEGVILMEMQFKELKAYYQIVEDLNFSDEQPLCSIDIALLENSDELNQRIEKTLADMFKAHPPLSAQKTDVINYQTMLKFYTYVKRLKDKENSSLDYLSTCEGTLEICNSSYVELYNCNLQSTLTSWVNQNGLIRTDRADAQLDIGAHEQLPLNKIKLHFTDCCLTDIQLIKHNQEEGRIKLHLTLTEFNDGELTNNNSTLNLLMEDKSITVSTEAVDEADLISVAQYFEEKTLQIIF
ncbi:MAG: hypothetical protein ACJAT7_002078 [Psychromonas sp.]|jgi:hypothetical protein|uniref:hypothetical protein n=1 Tax=Psychromonas sp. TaxID=1884585 RepID=UPI0039E3828F